MNDRGQFHGTEYEDKKKFISILKDLCQSIKQDLLDILAPLTNLVIAIIAFLITLCEEPKVRRAIAWRIIAFLGATFIMYLLGSIALYVAGR